MVWSYTCSGVNVTCYQAIFCSQFTIRDRLSQRCGNVGIIRKPGGSGYFPADYIHPVHADHVNPVNENLLYVLFNPQRNFVYR
jgi:hypothetical protein